MKKVLITFFLIISSIFYSSYFNLANAKTYSSVIDSAKLLENHIVKLKKQINIFKDTYSIYDDELITDSIRKLGIMEKGLKEIKERKITGEKASEYISTIVKALKEINNNLGPKLKEYISSKTQEADNYKQEYSSKVRPFIPKIRNLIVNLATNIKNKKRLTDKDKDVIKILTYINNYVDNLANFEAKNFKTKEEVKDYLVENIKNIKKEILHIKRILK